MIQKLALLIFLMMTLPAVAGDQPFEQVSISKPNPKKLWLRSHAAIVIDQHSEQTLYEKHANQALPIASITKLMTAMVLIDAKLDMQKILTITKADKDTLRYSRSRLPFGSSMIRADMLKMALMASENRAAAALARTFPGGTTAFVKAMNDKASTLEMKDSHFSDSTGLITENHSTARDLAILLKSAWQYDLIRQFSGTGSDSVQLQNKKRELKFNSTNPLLRRASWQIGMSKTGYIKESGRCLAMQTTIAGRDLFIVLLNAQGRLSSYGDSGRIRHWLEAFENRQQAKVNNL